MSQPFSTEFKATVVVVLLVMAGVSFKVLSEASRTEPRTEMVADSVQATFDIEYARYGREAVRLDVYQPTDWSTSLRPAILLIHGGGWIEGDKNGERDLAAFLVPQGFVAFAINYRLAHDGPSRYPAALLDVRRAMRWVRAHARDYGVDPDRIGAVGLSAGGHLAAVLGTTDVLDPADPNSGKFSSRANCVVDTAGPTDFTDDANPPVGQPIAQVIPTFFGESRAAIPQAYHDASPALLVDKHAAPTLIVHGTADPIVPIGQSRRFEQALGAAGVEVKLVELEGEDHGINQPLYRKRWLDEMAEFLIDHLEP